VSVLDRELLERALTALGRAAHAAGKVIDIAIYGGSCLVLVGDFRRATRDVDAVIGSDEAFVTAQAVEVGRALGLPDGWLNDGVRAYLAPDDAASRRYFGSYPSEAEPGLRLFVPAPEYMLAMKLMALRIDRAEGTQDLADILDLITITAVGAKEELVSLAAGFYPEARISGKLMLSLDGIWREKERRDRAGHPRPTWQPRRGGGQGQ
jgi:hypothetical protein